MAATSLTRPAPAQATRRPATLPLRVALVGCGAVARESLLPVLAGDPDISLVALVDRDERRARELADSYGVATVLTDLDALTSDTVDAVVIATPPGHHARATIACAGKGLHVLVEKPMAIAAADARAMIDAADQAGTVLAVSLYRRFLPSVRLLRALVERQEFGRLVAVDAEEGGPYSWQLATLDGLRRATGGGGPLIDIGTHVLDAILFVLQASPTLTHYADNERGGIETDCLLQASLATAQGPVPLRLELSRTRELRNTIRIVCEHATLELERANFTHVVVHRGNESPFRFEAGWAVADDISGYEAFRRELDDWVTAIAQGTEPVLAARTAAPVVELIEQAYAARVPLVEPGDEEPARAPAVKREGGARRRVVVTGAGGFLGGRTVEMLRDHPDWQPVALVREPRSAARLARWPDDILLADVCTREELDRAFKGADAVVHCAVGTSWKADETRRVTVDGTRTVAEAALAAGVKRLVHISSLFVHKRDAGGTIDETTPLDPPQDDEYGRNKLDAERALAEVGAKGLSTIVLRPTRIYGPFSRTFTVRPLQALWQGRLVIAGDCDVPANMVYVDNVVAAILAALNAPEARSGAAYLITDDEQLTLRQFYDYFGAADGLAVRVGAPPPARAPRTPALPVRVLGGLRSIATSPELRGIVRRVLDTEPIGTWPRRLWDRSPKMQQVLLKRFGSDPAVVYRRPAASADDLPYWGEPALVVGARIAQDLAYTPAFGRDDAMARTLTWARYARLLPARQGPA